MKIISYSSKIIQLNIWLITPSCILKPEPENNAGWGRNDGPLHKGIICRVTNGLLIEIPSGFASGDVWVHKSVQWQLDQHWPNSSEDFQNCIWWFLFSFITLLSIYHHDLGMKRIGFKKILVFTQCRFSCFIHFFRVCVHILFKKMFFKSIKLLNQNMLVRQGHCLRPLRPFTLTPTHSVSNISLGQEQYWPVKHLNSGATASLLPVFDSAACSLSLSLELLSSSIWWTPACISSISLTPPLARPHQISRSLKLRTTSHLSLKAQQLPEDLEYRRKSVIVLGLN